MNDSINIDSTIAGSKNDNINIDSTIAGSMKDHCLCYCSLYVYVVIH
jgi:hypothetical protein